MPNGDNEQRNLPSVQLKAGQLIDNALANLTVKQQQDLMARAADEALNLEVRARNMRIDSDQSSKDIQNHIDAFNCLNKEGKFDSHELRSEIKTASGRMTIQSNRGVKAGCFVATAAFGNEEHETVALLRRYRDNVLSKSRLGKSFISWYYHNGPLLAEWLIKHKRLIPITRAILSTFALAVKKIIGEGRP